MLTDKQGKLSGLFTDSDLARLFEERREETLDRRIAEVMTVGPTVVQRGMMVRDAVERLASRHISELPVVDQDGRPCGMIDITDVVSWIPSENAREPHVPPSHGGVTIPFTQAYRSAPHRESA
jgi:arabinose-5-phosphate isomerase